MKILILTPSVNPDSGWGRYSSEIIDAFEKSNLSLKVLALDGYIKLKPTRFFLSHIYNAFLVRKHARDVQVVHSFEGWIYGIYAYFAVLGTNKKLFISGIGTYSVTPLDSKILGAVLKIVYKKAKNIFCISHFTASEISKRVPGAKVSVVHMGTKLISLPTEKDKQIVEKRIDGRGPVLLTVGALKERKGQLYTTQAVAELKKLFPEILYVIVGDQSDQFYKNQIDIFIKKYNLEENILFAEKVTDEELAAWYSATDVFALNSVNHQGHFEGFGLVILEANQFGKPAVGSRNCGIEDAIDNGINGYLANQGDYVNIAEKIKMAMNIKNSQKIIDFSRKFSWDKTAREYIKEYVRTQSI